MCLRDNMTRHLIHQICVINTSELKFMFIMQVKYF